METMTEYTWVVLKGYSVVGYVRCESEWKAMKIAQSTFGKNVVIERSYLVGVVPPDSVVSYCLT